MHLAALAVAIQRDHVHPVADGKARNARTHRLDDACALHAEPGRQRLHRVLAAPHQYVAEVERDRRMTHSDLAGTGRREVDVLVAHHLGAAGLVKTECLHDEFSASVMTRFWAAKKTHRKSRGQGLAGR